MTDGLLDFNPHVSPLKHTSPSRMLAMDDCALREVWAASGAEDLLPRSPAARLGTVIHALLELAGRGALGDENTDFIDKKWQQLVDDAQDGMLGGWLARHYVPLSSSVPSYEVRRIQAVSRALLLARAASKLERDESLDTVASGQLLTGYEVPVATADGIVRGRIDAVSSDEQGAVIRDYKSGLIFEWQSDGRSAIKSAYQTQLKMYAALYEETTSVWPVRLEVVPVLGAPVPVTFEQIECSNLLDRARRQLVAVNDLIKLRGPGRSLEARLAHPRPSVCGYCSFRPGCLEYRAARLSTEGDWPHDVWGRLVAIKRTHDDHLVVELEQDGSTVRIRSLSTNDRHPALSIAQLGNIVAAFNVRPTGSESTFAESPHTTIYKIGDAEISKSAHAERRN
jgi:hypothetical protein